MAFLNAIKNQNDPAKDDKAKDGKKQSKAEPKKEEVIPEVQVQPGKTEVKPVEPEPSEPSSNEGKTKDEKAGGKTRFNLDAITLGNAILESKLNITGAQSLKNWITRPGRKGKKKNRTLQIAPLEFLVLVIKDLMKRK